MEMSPQPKDNLGNWVKLTFGGLFFIIGLDKLYIFATTGKASFRHFRGFPFDLEGANAAAVYGLCVVIGALLLASGAKGLLGK